MSNTYRFSTRDGKKNISVNGVDISPECDVSFDWGWYGVSCLISAMRILDTEYGETTSNTLHRKFARNYLANIEADEFVLTSGAIDFIINKLEMELQNEPSQRS
jgi:hypothetical protein